jgi:hypothetical protein
LPTKSGGYPERLGNPAARSRPVPLMRTGRPREGLPLTCEGCGKSFYASPSRARRFCSLACRCDFFTPTPEQNEARFWSYVDRRGPDECWPWLGATRSGGYGQINIGGRIQSALIAAWEFHHKHPFPQGAYGLHQCNNPPCVNPHHCQPGTQAENIQTSVRIKTHRNSRKTHCEHGHELTEANIFRRASRPHKRECLICRLDYIRAGNKRRA